MRNIKLKPLFLPKDDILIQPPSFLALKEIPKDKSSKMYLSNLDDLKTILRGRRLKSGSLKARRPIKDDLESVKKLNEFRAPSKLGISPISRKYTFHRSPSTTNQDTSPARQIISKFEENPSFIIALQTILGFEKQKTKDLDQEISKFTESNRAYEKTLTLQMEKVSAEVEQVSLLILKCKAGIQEVRAQRNKEIKEFDEKMNQLMTQETHHTLSAHSHVGKKNKVFELSEEQDYFIVKEKIRKAKSELHASHVELIERSGTHLEYLLGLLQNYQVQKKNNQNEIKELQESLVNFYCMNLKEVMDLREDGIKWTIKALWNMNQPVPVSAFPKYLDDESSHFLLFMAEKDLENIYLNKKLNELREEIKKDRMNSSFTKTHSELYGIVKERLREIKQKSRPLSLNSTLATESRESVEESKYARYDEIQRTKSKLKNNESTITKMTLEEINRVVGLYNSETNKIGITNIIKALVGEKFREFMRIAKKKFSNKD